MRKSLIFALAGLFSLSAFSQNVVWFDEPNTLNGRQDNIVPGKKLITARGEGHNNAEWERRSLPLGNGSIGASVLGSIDVECYALNEKTLWRGGPNTAKGPEHYWNVNKQSAHLLKEIRQAFTDGDWNKAAALTANNFNSPVSYESAGEPEFRFGSYTALGELYIKTGIDPKNISDYSRALSLDSAFTKVSFVSDGVRYERQSFISYPNNVLAIRFTASEKGKQNLNLSYGYSPVSKGNITAEGKNGLVFKGQLDNNKMEYVVRLRAITKGGTLSNENGCLKTEGADEVVFLLTADTDYKPNYDPDYKDPKAYVGVNPDETTTAWMKAAEKKSWKKLFNTHYKDYANLFDRVRFNLAGETSQKPTNERLKDYRKGKADRGLETLYFQFGRYLLIASSRPGNLPANLQGIWNNDIDGPWRVDYHNNINLQMNYWPALSTNLTECAEPLTDFIKLLEKPGQKTAKAYWGARGWAAGISANIFGFTAPLEGRDMAWNYNPMAASWLATHLWDYYDYTRDKKFLRETAYPLIKGCALFCEDFLWHKPDGTLTAAPSTSPEHGPIDEGTTFTHAVIREILLNAIDAAEVLNVDKMEVQTWKSILAQLAPYRIGRYGQLMEWSKDIDDPKDKHRHVNHLYGLHPGHTISPITTPELAEAARVVLNHRGDGATGWSMGWKLNQWARLHDGNRSHKLYGNLLKNGTADNLWDVHPPFQIDGNFGGTAGVTEMLLQSHTGCLHLLPSLPDAWATGSVSGLRARGNFGVDMAWENGKLNYALISSDSGEICHLRYGNATIDFPTHKGKTYRVTLKNGVLSVE